MGKRKGKIRPLSTTRFMVLWVGAAIAIYVLQTLAYEQLLPLSDDFWLPFTIISLAVWTLTALVESWLLKRLLRRAMRAWIPLTVIALSVGQLLSLLWGSTFYELTYSWSPFAQLLLTSFFVITVPAILQWAFLRRRVSHAGLWVIGALIVTVGGAAVEKFIGDTMDIELIFLIFLGFTGFSALVMGLSAIVIAHLNRRASFPAEQFDSGGNEETDYGRLVDDTNNQQADETSLVQRRAQSY